MKRLLAVVGFGLACVASATPSVFINEIFRNPPGGEDDFSEYIELLGTPGMKLDGYAIASLDGTLQKYYPLGSIPPAPNPRPEIDEFFSLDGLTLGHNGILVIGIGLQSDYPTLLADTNFQRWANVWNGFLDTNGKLQNDGSQTVMLIRNRPGGTQATDPAPPVADLRWGKDVSHDVGLFTPVNDPQDGIDKDQWGNGAIDKDDVMVAGGVQMHDLRGALTLADMSDDLEIVDEISYEQDRGWEYDVDDRKVDVGSTNNGLPERNVHTLDDPQGFNPDALTRVDYRTKGAGWAPVSGATGEMTNGNNWQDTATEQWIRGESVEDPNVDGGWRYDNTTNTNADAIQPYRTNVPLWLNDNSGADYDFTTLYDYPIAAGRLNPLAVPYIPGDTDRDGDCDADDIAKLAAVFGDDDWIFSNSFADAPEGKNGDPATQTRPWDVDGTGDNGIEASDLQWTLNFQGNTDGRIVGVAYDSNTPTVSGVYLSPNAGVAVAVSWSLSVASGRALDNLKLNDLVTATVSAEVTGGANATSGQRNGVMQYVHDVALSVGGVLQVESITPLGGFATTNAGKQSLQGVSGDLGVSLVNGYSTDFGNGIGSATPLYEVTLRAVAPGDAMLSLAPAAEAKFVASTPRGVKVGHTDHNGDPASASYPAAVLLGGVCPGDADGDGGVNITDLGAVLSAFGSTGSGLVGDVDNDGDVDITDLGIVLANFGTVCS